MARLTREARQVLANLELVMHGKAASWNSSGGKGENENPVPQGEANPPADQWLDRFLHARDHDLPSLVDEARAELQAIRRRDPDILVPEEDRDAWEERLIEEGEGYEAKVVATSFSTSVQVVTKARRKHKRDPNFGYLLQHTPELPPEEKRAKVVALREAGVSTRDIATRLGMHQTQVMRWCKA